MTQHRPLWEGGEDLELDWKGRTRPDQRGVPTSVGADGNYAPRYLPGDPRDMSSELRHTLAGLLQGDSLTVKQVKEWGEILTGWETRNRYDVFDGAARSILFAGETGEGVLHSLVRNFWGFRTVQLEFMTHAGTLALTVKKPWTFWMRRFEVIAWDGRLMGVIQQRWHLYHRRYDLLSPSGQVLAEITGALWKPFTFGVTAPTDGRVLAVIRKSWGSFGTEVFTDADSFGVQFAPDLTDARLRQLILAATLAIDLSHFENKSRPRSSGLSLVSGWFD